MLFEPLNTHYSLSYIYYYQGSVSPEITLFKFVIAIITKWYIIMNFSKEKEVRIFYL
jgi:hypothetical protein